MARFSDRFFSIQNKFDPITPLKALLYVKSTLML